MNKKIFFVFMVLVLIFLASGIVRQEYLLLEFYYKDGALTLINTTLEKGNYPTISHDVGREYELKLVSSDNESLYSINFDPLTLYTDGFVEGIEGNVIGFEEIVFYVPVPSLKEAEKVELFKDEEKIFEEEVYDVGAKKCRLA